MTTRHPRTRRTALAAAALSVATALGGLLGAPTAAGQPTGAGAQAATTARASEQDAVIGSRLLGRSVRGRPIRAWHLGEPRRRGVDTVVLIASMHGNEGAPRQILTSLRDGAPITGVDLWVVPHYNPDGLVAGSRRNAHGVDLNRNYPYAWADLDGSYESGPRPASEPETRAMMRFLERVRPDWVLSFHQPLHGVDTDTKRPRFAMRVADKLNLPHKRFDCGGVCHGTMTMWFNHNFAGTALTVEYGARPSRRLMRRVAPPQVLSVFGARRLKAHPEWVD